MYSQKGGFQLAYHQYFLVLDVVQRGVHLHLPYPPWICHCILLTNNSQQLEYCKGKVPS
jgi:hypothetical protein